MVYMSGALEYYLDMLKKNPETGTLGYWSYIR